MRSELLKQQTPCLWTFNVAIVQFELRSDFLWYGVVYVFAAWLPFWPLFVRRVDILRQLIVPSRDVIELLATCDQFPGPLTEAVRHMFEPMNEPFMPGRCAAPFEIRIDIGMMGVSPNVHQNGAADQRYVLFCCRIRLVLPNPGLLAWGPNVTFSYIGTILVGQSKLLSFHQYIKNAN